MLPWSATHAFAQIGEQLSSAKGDFILGGDFNCLPSVVRRSQAAKVLNAQIVAPNDKKGPCKGRLGRSRVIDYFLVPINLKHAVDKVEIICRTKSKTSPHSPVLLTFCPRPSSVQVRKLDEPAALPTDRLPGPLQVNPAWRSFRVVAIKTLSASASHPRKVAFEAS